MARPSSTLLCQLVMTNSDLRYGLHSEGRDDLEDADNDQPDASDPDHDAVGRHRVHEHDHAADEQDDTEEDVPAASLLVREALEKSGESLEEKSDADEDSQQPLATQTGVGAGRKQAKEDRQRTGNEVEVRIPPVSPGAKPRTTLKMPDTMSQMMKMTARSLPADAVFTTAQIPRIKVTAPKASRIHQFLPIDPIRSSSSTITTSEFDMRILPMPATGCLPKCRPNARGGSPNFGDVTP